MPSDVTIYGASDDLIEVEGQAPGCDEYAAEDATFVLSSQGRAVRVRMVYGNSGLWEATIRPLYEDCEAPPIQVYTRKYTAVVVVSGVELVVREAVSDE